MLDALDGPPRPTARADLTQLTKAVVGFIEGAQGLPFARGSDPKSLCSCLQECLQEWKDDTHAAQRELHSLRQTVALLQAERRSTVNAPPPAQAEDAVALRAEVERLRAMSPLWEMVQEGVDLSKVQWTSH